jgi:uncharacterized protein (TIGR00297 family)
VSGGPLLRPAALRRLPGGLALAGGVAAFGWRRRLLTPSGALAAVACGATVTAGGGWGWAGALVAFFLSGSALSRLKGERKAALDDVWEKGSRRDAGQVWANGGVGALAALAQARRPTGVAAAVFFGSLATSAADTWATELGVLASAPPRRITDGRPVPRGASGGVTALGLLASAGGAALIGAVAGLSEAGPRRPRALAQQAAAVALAGVAGALFDSLLGAAFQAAYRCPACDLPTERRVHRCGQATVLVRGWRWLDNDAVNFVSSLAGALIALALRR